MCRSGCDFRRRGAQSAALRCPKALPCAPVGHRCGSAARRGRDGGGRRRRAARAAAAARRGGRCGPRPAGGPARRGGCHEAEVPGGGHPDAGANHAGGLDEQLRHAHRHSGRHGCASFTLFARGVSELRDAAAGCASRAPGGPQLAALRVWGCGRRGAAAARLRDPAAHRPAHATHRRRWVAGRRVRRVHGRV
jgi:hypothetical protein